MILSKGRPGVYYIIIGLAIALYLFLTFNTPTNPETLEKYDLTPANLFWLRMTLIVPILLVWVAGAHAFTAISRHVNLLRADTNIDSDNSLFAFSKLRVGIGIIFWSFVASSLMNTISTYIAGGGSDYAWRPMIVILRNYINIFSLLIGFIFILMSAKLFLSKVSGEKRISKNWMIALGIIFSALAFIYLDLIFANPFRSVAPPGENATFYLPDSLIILTVIGPVFAAWIIGLFATKKLSIYSRLVEGKIYKDLFRNVVIGLNALIILSVFSNSLSAMGSQKLAGLDLSGILVLVYFIVAMLSIAYLYLARAFAKLSKIELV